MRVFSSGNVMISRRMIDEILSDSYLDNDHIDAFAILLNEKSKISPDEYQKYLYISPIYWVSILVYFIYNFLFELFNSYI